MIIPSLSKLKLIFPNAGIGIGNGVGLLIRLYLGVRDTSAKIYMLPNPDGLQPRCHVHKIAAHKKKTNIFITDKCPTVSFRRTKAATSFAPGSPRSINSLAPRSHYGYTHKPPIVSFADHPNPINSAKKSPARTLTLTLSPKAHILRCHSSITVR